MASQPLRWGILGVAKINDRLIPAFAQATSATLLAIASRSAERATSAAKAAGIPRAYGSYESLLEDPEIDAVYIPLPNHLHDKWTRKATAAGKHVLCEKPLTPDATTACALIEHCQGQKVTVMDGFMWPHHPRTHELRRLIDAGSLGRVERVDACFTFLLPLDSTNIRLQSTAGGGSLLDVGCYPVFGIRWAMGAEPIRVLASARFLYGVDVALTAILWFADGRIATLDCGFHVPLRQSMSIVGSAAVVDVPQMWLPGPEAEFMVTDTSGQGTRHTCPCDSQIVCMLDDFALAVQGAARPWPSLSDAYLTLQVLDALALSARESRPVELSAV